MLSGRTGTRANIGRPQVRWQDGVELAKMLAPSVPLGNKGHVSVGTRMFEAMRDLKNQVAHFPSRARALFDLPSASDSSRNVAA